MFIIQIKFYQVFIRSGNNAAAVFARANMLIYNVHAKLIITPHYITKGLFLKGGNHVTYKMATFMPRQVFKAL